MKLAILAAGKPVYREHPSASEQVLSDIPAARWTMSVVGATTSNTQIVVGYEYEEIQRALPDVNLQLNPDWQRCGSVGSFLSLNFDECDSILATYSDIVFGRRLVENLGTLNADVVVAWDSKFLSRFVDTTRVLEEISVEGTSVVASGVGARGLPNVGFFPGVVKFSPQALAQIKEMPEQARVQLSKSHLSELVEYLLRNGANVRAVECNGQWARIEEPGELVRFILGSKADTLVQLKPLVSKSEIPQSFVFDVGEWSTRKDDILSKIDKSWPDQDLVVRSSARAEDTFEQSMAGAFLSVLGVSGRSAIERAIEQVMASYPDSNPDNQVIVQPKVQELIANGVVFTRSLGNDAPWLTINFEISERSDGITSGKSNASLTLNIFRPSVENWIDRAKRSELLKNLPDWMPNLLEAIRELEDITHYSRLDIEFGVDSIGRVHIFQVRPLTSIDGLGALSDEDFERALERAKLDWKSFSQKRRKGAKSNLSIFSNMTDWNPAEILGAVPRQLATSLYEGLITKRVWAESRAYFGYRKLADRPLLKDIAGRPYVDVAASIESLLPGQLPSKHCDALLDFFLNWLKNHPEQHDKVEFEVVPTCLTPRFPTWAVRLAGIGGFHETIIENYRDGLRSITRQAIRSIKEDFELVATLDQKFEQVSGISSISPMKTVQQVLEICRQYGTFPFSNLARRAFIAVTLLKDAAGAGIVSSAAVEDFLATIRTVSHSFSADAGAVGSGSMSWDDFVSTYGHLRPGTYDINSPRYDSEPERFLRPLVDRSKNEFEEKVAGSQWAMERYALFEWVRNELDDFSDDEIENFLRTAIEGRESAKFSFTRLLSWVLEEVKELAREWNMSVDHMSHLRIEQILEAATENQVNPSSREKLVAISETNRKAHELASHMKVPGFISSSEDLFAFVTGHEVPNFVGNKPIIDTLVHIVSGETEHETLAGKIVFIEAADPGFDWIFGHDIAGLVTKYGGANSHMAIRAAEFGLPAAIGVGDSLFDELLTKETIELDPTNQIVRGLS